MSEYNVAPYSEDAQPDKISPEGAEVANAYLRNGCSAYVTAQELNLPVHEVSSQISQPIVKQYVTSVLKEHGMQHMEKISAKMDELIELKWEELQEAEIGSNKDIADLLNMAHKMRKDMQTFLQEDTKTVTNQKNIQVNTFEGTSYGKLLERLLG